MRIDAPWLTRPETRAVCAALTDAGCAAYLVGGCVRNALMGLPATDIDVATDAQPARVMEIATAAGLHAVPTGFEHGTVTLVANGTPFEVTTFRRDLATDGRRATVAFSANLREDAERRDFTMNALYATPDGDVVDPLGGLADLRARRVRFVGDAATRIAEDTLRILRFFRFHAWYGDAAAGLDPAGLAACAEGRAGLDGLSRERVGAEMARLLAAPDPAPAVAAMAETGVLARTLPGADATTLPALVAVEDAVDVAPDWRTCLAALGSSSGWAERLRLSRADARALEAIETALDAAAPPAAAAYRHGADAACGAALIAAARRGAPPPEGLKAALARGAEAVFPLHGGDIALKGPELGAELKRLEAIWIASDFILDADALRAASPSSL